MRPLQVMLVVDSLRLRRSLDERLASHPQVKVTYSTGTGTLALNRIDRFPVDAVIVDASLSDMRCLDLVKSIRVTRPRLPIVVLMGDRNLSVRDRVEIRSVGCCTQLEMAVEEARTRACSDLLATQIVTQTVQLCRAENHREIGRVAGRNGMRVEAVCIAASTGGPEALARVLADLRAPLSVPVLIVQHMSAAFTKGLAEQLSRKTGHNVLEAVAGHRVARGDVLLAPGGLHMEVRRYAERVVVRTHEEPPENSVRPAADVLLRSATQAYRGQLLCVVLTGMGADGAQGCQIAKQAGAYVVVQDEETSKVWGMPGSTVRTGCVDEIVPLGSVGGLIGSMLRRSAGDRGAQTA
ncbi:MAG: chemotaxis protein CheB [Pseudomonadales bacterium]